MEKGPVEASYKQMPLPIQATDCFSCVQDARIFFIQRKRIMAFVLNKHQ